ncbi:MAG: phosphoenolpyruvate carboxykinase domain-containing protein, partial [Pseudomonadota bacterium]
GKSDERPARDWRGADYADGSGPAAHPNSRFTVSIKRCPSYSDQAEAPQGVPISAIVFGGRRERLVPLVMEAKDWRHGVLLGASMASETTAAATGAVGVVRRDPMAMKPFCGYNFADYFSHWLTVGEKAGRAPKVFHVNWFRKDENGRFMWPGFGENMRVLRWIVGRCRGEVGAQDTAIGLLPTPADLDVSGLDLAPETLEALLSLDLAGWQQELSEIGTYLESYGERLPAELAAQQRRVAEALQA